MRYHCISKAIISEDSYVRLTVARGGTKQVGLYPNGRWTTRHLTGSLLGDVVSYPPKVKSKPKAIIHRKVAQLANIVSRGWSSIVMTTPRKDQWLSSSGLFVWNCLSKKLMELGWTRILWHEKEGNTNLWMMRVKHKWCSAVTKGSTTQYLVGVHFARTCISVCVQGPR